MIGNAIAGLYGVGVTPSTTAYESIATVTVGAGGSSTITFSSIPSTYTHLQIRILQRSSGSGSNFSDKLQFNGNTTSSDYREHGLYGNGSSAAALTTQQWYIAQGAIPASGNSAGIFGVAIIDILDYANTNKYKTVRALSGFDANGSGHIMIDSMLWMKTDAISSITMEAYTTDLTQYSSFALYGIKGA